MFDWDDILIIGDSFCQYRFSDNEWPFLLASQLTGHPRSEDRRVRGQGEPGTSWWTARRLLFEELKIKPPKVLVMCHTEIQRIPSQHDFALNMGSVFASQSLHHNPIVRPEHPNEHKYVPEIREAAQLYYKYLSFDEYSEWAWRSWASELDNLIDEYKIPYVIHLFAFVNSAKDMLENKNTHTFRNGISDTSILWRICDDRHAPLQSDKEFKNNVYQYRRNHFSPENNVKIANALYNALMDYKPGLQNLNLLGTR